MELFERAIKKDVAILPGLPFYTDGGGFDTVRLNFSNSTPERIEEGISRRITSYNVCYTKLLRMF